MNTAEALLGLARAWLLTGGLVAAVFLSFGIDRVDPHARGAYFFRPLLVPGILLVWPLVLWRWWVLETGREDWQRRHRPPRRVHGRVALGLAVLVPLVLATGLAIRQHWPADAVPERLSAPAAADTEAGQ